MVVRTYRTEHVKCMNTASVLTFQKRGVSFICGLFAQSTTLRWLSVNRIRRKNSNGAHPVQNWLRKRGIPALSKNCRLLSFFRDTVPFGA